MEIRPKHGILQEFSVLFQLRLKEHLDHGGGLHALLRGTIIPPIAARIRLLGRKRRRGRRPQAAPAWMRQPFNLSTPIAHPEQSCCSWPSITRHACI